MSGPGELRVLGPVEAVGPAGRALVHGTRQRAVLGVLALHAGTVLPASRLIDVLWGENPPRTAVKTLHSHVARIRQALAACGFPTVLRTREPGYLLAVEPESVDALLFDRQVRAAREHLARDEADRAAQQLRAALGLWRGDAFADAALEGWGCGEVETLHEQRLAALEDLWDAELRLDRHADAVRELPRLVSAHPTRERLAGLYMLALHRCGQHTEALAVFRALRTRLTDEFGVDPGPELLALHTSILRRDPSLDPRPAVRGPAQLPARVGHFTGRVAESAALDAMLADPSDERPVVVISAAAGMGKTAFAVQWAHRAADRFPDGQLFLDLGGHDSGRALSASDALAHVLRALDVPDERMPAELPERAALYRSLLHGRRCLVLADNAGDVEQVLPLVPGNGRTLLVVTSRQTLAALGTRHAVHPVALDSLGHAESLELLTRVLGADRVAREPGASARLGRLCGGMPLALRLAAARLVSLPGRTVAESAAELVGAGRLDTLAVEGDSRTVRAVFASAYEPLEPGRARVFRLLGLAPGTSVSAWLGATLCGVPPERARESLSALAAAHLVTETERDRYRFHDLVREFAAGRVEREERAIALSRLVDWYLVVADEANKVIDPNRDLVTPSLRHPRCRVPFDDRHGALAFLDAERANLRAVAQCARELGRLDSAWQLTYLLTSFYDATGHWHDRVELCRQGAAAATALGDPVAEAEMLRALGVAYFMTRRLKEALETNQRALKTVRAAGDLAGEGHVHNNIANAYAELRRFDEAIAAHRLAVARCAEAGSDLGRALSQRNLGHTFVRMGRAEESLTPLTDALATFRGLGNARLEAATLDTLGEAWLQRGDHGAALAHLREAVEVSRAIGDRWLEWESLLDTGRAHLDSGDVRAAVAHFSAALDLSREVGDRHGESSALNQLGRAYLAAGDLAAARENLERSLSIRTAVPDDYELAHLHRDLGDLESRAGDSTTATRHWSRARSLYSQANATTEAEELSARLTP
ncbi:BTAD domain-containing putative transcriptional regulator [Actinokineospora auranticolor]|uniref:DNA-binding SARP family transcriptional activator n=1 Tax=Actinokineospora auranticolor TaxID=155976 RepID=A0A2S6GMP9_9PSEU|nr:BTAD domain-containing putative transcriptional regulator [Actinokineospora auranticolor]PPK66411.1 DNA-binding SARP family transcriptional activator [Actinokineospora auranticolor]